MNFVLKGGNKKIQGDNKTLIIRSSAEEFLTFKIQEGDKGIQVRYDKDTLWMTQKAMSELFDTGIDNINVHLKNIFDSSELDKTSTIEENSIVQKEGNRNVTRKLLWCYCIYSEISLK